MSVLTPANQLTMMRVLLAPAFVILTVYGHFGWALITFGIAGLTDMLDGLIARRLGARTSLGTWLDPMADKLLIVATVSVLTVPGLGLVNKLPVWLTILIISRDLLIVLTVAVINFAIGRREFRPSIYGKIATATYILTCITIMYFNYLQRTSALVTLGIYASAAITLISFTTESTEVPEPISFEISVSSAVRRIVFATWRLGGKRSDHASIFTTAL
jgi:cardiolipin synthase